MAMTTTERKASQYLARRKFKDKFDPATTVTPQMLELSDRIAACIDIELLKALGVELVHLTKGNTFQFTYMQTKFSRRKEHIRVLNNINKCQRS